MTGCASSAPSLSGGEGEEGDALPVWLETLARQDPRQSCSLLLEGWKRDTRRLKQSDPCLQVLIGVQCKLETN
jgi:hypothetical protein